ncbi:MAG: hypothetical protein K9N35_11090, partial [Candidatus Marinimicrobia bacterium]|nr:hypothetical protein [Candidatus Neomarinimicrobiota bacterium]
SADACTKEDDNQNMAKWKSPTKSGDLVRLFTVSSRLKPVNLYQDETYAHQCFKLGQPKSIS